MNARPVGIRWVSPAAAFFIVTFASAQTPPTPAEVECAPAFVVMNPAAYYSPQIEVTVYAQGTARQRVFAFPSIARCQESLRMLRDVLAWVPTDATVRVLDSNCTPPQEPIK